MCTFGLFVYYIQRREKTCCFVGVWISTAFYHSNGAQSSTLHMRTVSYKSKHHVESNRHSSSGRTTDVIACISPAMLCSRLSSLTTNDHRLWIVVWFFYFFCFFFLFLLLIVHLAQILMWYEKRYVWKIFKKCR